MESTKRTLIVEDSPEVRLALGDLLHGRWPNSQTTSVASEHEAREALMSTRFDIAIVDLHLAQGSGIAVLKYLASLPARPFVIVFSDAATPKIRDFCLEHGAHAFIDKAGGVELLIGVLHALH